MRAAAHGSSMPLTPHKSGRIRAWEHEQAQIQLSSAMLGCRKQPMHSSANSSAPSSQSTNSRPHLRPITTRSATLLPTEVHPCSPTPPHSQSLPRPRSCPIARQSIALTTQPTASNLFSITYQPLPQTEALRPTLYDTYHPPVLGNIYMYYLVNVY